MFTLQSFQSVVLLLRAFVFHASTSSRDISLWNCLLSWAKHRKANKTCLVVAWNSTLLPSFNCKAIENKSCKVQSKDLSLKIYAEWKSNGRGSEKVNINLRIFCFLNFAVFLARLHPLRDNEKYLSLLFAFFLSSSFLSPLSNTNHYCAPMKSSHLVKPNSFVGLFRELSLPFTECLFALFSMVSSFFFLPSAMNWIKRIFAS